MSAAGNCAALSHLEKDFHLIQWLELAPGIAIGRAFSWA
jgi:hypothetical protein